MYVASASSVAFIAVGYLTHVVVLTLSVRWFFDFCTGRVSSDHSYVLMHVVSPLSRLCFKGFRFDNLPVLLCCRTVGTMGFPILHRSVSV